MLKPKLKSAVLAIAALTFAACLIMMPTETLAASKRGLNIWWGTVFPSLLPFFITGELLIGFGVVHFIGVLFEPIMRPIFNVPGVGSFVWAMGLASGYPAGAKFTSRMRLDQDITKVEAERLVSFTNASNPLFIIAAVSVGFFQTPALGILLVLAHYGSNLLVGMVMRFYKHKEDRHIQRTSHTNIWYRAFETLHKMRLNQNKPFGKMFGDAVIHSVETLLMIGGFIIIFSVFANVLLQIGLAPFLGKQISLAFTFFDLPTSLALPFFNGLFEVTLGAQQIANLSQEPLLAKAILVSILLAFNGFSVQAQVASILAETDISFKPYFFGRILQGGFSALIVLVMYNLVIPSFQRPIGAATAVQGFNTPILLEQTASFLVRIGPAITLLTLWLALFILISRSLKNSR
ncbi:sporulation integral membrane protein YlbJ [Amphibacillus sediminis]|uniref:sporulation integral membrane protein YlbJ n=1 Tax=Amphibacillus sediminis TaxID=360185 RepID=UPI00082AF5FE|nr:sporulation integral membrane protein YlbJ [Amphibacillus sediminis]